MVAIYSFALGKMTLLHFKRAQLTCFNIFGMLYPFARVEDQATLMTSQQV